jgi:hypothetical protein
LENYQFELTAYDAIKTGNPSLRFCLRKVSKLENQKAEQISSSEIIKNACRMHFFTFSNPKIAAELTIQACQ